MQLIIQTLRLCTEVTMLMLRTGSVQPLAQHYINCTASEIIVWHSNNICVNCKSRFEFHDHPSSNYELWQKLDSASREPSFFIYLFVFFPLFIMGIPDTTDCKDQFKHLYPQPQITVCPGGSLEVPKPPGRYRPHPRVGPQIYLVPNQQTLHLHHLSFLYN